jgi:hypothetical protein
MVLFQEFNVEDAVEFLFFKSRPLQTISSSSTLQYNKFASGKYKGWDLDDLHHVLGHDLNNKYIVF